MRPSCLRGFEVKLTQIESHQTEWVRKILTIHDQMPLEWDPEHKPSEDFLQNLIRKIQASDEPQGFWVLNGDAEPTERSEILGTLWASLKISGRDTLTCSIKSIWIKPELRKQSLSLLLTNACKEWAKVHSATQLSCSTHFTNIRMRGILEQNDFAPGMVDFTRSL